MKQQLSHLNTEASLSLIMEQQSTPVKRTSTEDPETPTKMAWTPSTPKLKDPSESIPVGIEGHLTNVSGIYQRYFGFAAEIMDSEPRAAKTLITKGCQAMPSAMTVLKTSANALLGKCRSQAQTIEYLRRELEIAQTQLALTEYNDELLDAADSQPHTSDTGDSEENDSQPTTAAKPSARQ